MRIRWQTTSHHLHSEKLLGNKWRLQVVTNFYIGLAQRGITSCQEQWWRLPLDKSFSQCQLQIERSLSADSQFYRCCVWLWGPLGWLDQTIVCHERKGSNFGNIKTHYLGDHLYGACQEPWPWPLLCMSMKSAYNASLHFYIFMVDWRRNCYQNGAGLARAGYFTC